MKSPDYNLQLINFKEVVDRYLKKTEARRPYGKILNTLKNEAPNGVTNFRLGKERYFLKELLDFYSTVEIAYITGFIPTELPKKFVRDAIQILGFNEVSAYRLDTYGSLLPTHFMNRLQSKVLQKYHSSEELESLFIDFLDLKSQIEDDEQLMDCLNNKSEKLAMELERINQYQGIVLSKLQLSDELFLDSLANTNEAFLSYVAFIDKYYELLNKCDDYPELKVSLLHYFIHPIDHKNQAFEFLMETYSNNSESFLDEDSWIANSLTDFKDKFDTIKEQMLSTIGQLV